MFEIAAELRRRSLWSVRTSVTSLEVTEFERHLPKLDVAGSIPVARSFGSRGEDPALQGEEEPHDAGAGEFVAWNSPMWLPTVGMSFTMRPPNERHCGSAPVLKVTLSAC